ncbi:putative membrane protein [Besnoitia besnoiti]|uniref:Putative membrane protein n=1 Tax=Besnoitia besnoiti TaxID=94643 RepID=A0A2A9M8H3_BESBE|nr:putative membrane protein [Besnoitia besnoiti]PFH31937.1 putative membrane protein [Besnoitia besnoiti]
MTTQALWPIVINEVERRLKEQYGGPPSNLALQDEKAIETTLTEHLGSDFYDQYRVVQTAVPQDEETAKVKNFILMLKQQFHKLRKLEDVYIRPNWSHFQEISAVSKAMPVGPSYTHVPCRDDASCKKLEHLVNTCNYARKGAMTASGMFNVITHVLNSVMSVLCGCLFVGPVHLCVLKNFPYTCKLPYPVYSSLFMATSQVWEAVKATTSICRVYGDPGFSSVMS